MANNNLSNLDSLIKTLRDESLKYAYSSKILSFNDTEAYKAIISIGKDALPTLLEELKQSPAFWLVHILRDITGVNLVNNTNRGKLNLIALAWLNWAKAQNLTKSVF